MRRRLLASAVLFAAAAGFGAAPAATAGDGRGAGGGRDAGAPVPGAAIARSPEFAKAVSDAIERGVAHLRTQQEADGGFGTVDPYPCALTAIAYHTLRTCGVPDTDPACARAYEALRKESAAAMRQGRMRTYAAGLTMLAVADHALAWTPDRAKRRAAPARLADERDRAWMNELVAYLENCQSTGGGWRYGESQPYGRRTNSDDYDHSNTQYAAQGLRAAGLIGCEVKTETWVRLAEHLLAKQEHDGPPVSLVPRLAKGATGAATQAAARGWGYTEIRPAQTTDGDADGDADGGGRRRRRAARRSNAYGSMTAGCAATLAMARDELRGRSRVPAGLVGKCDVGVRDGIAWLARHFDVTGNPNFQGWHFYYLYALERAGDLADFEWMGEHDWYGEGAELLIRAQEPDGAWCETAPEVAANCFALLFLRRAALGLRPVTPGAGEDAIHFDVAAKLSDRDFEDLVDLVVARWSRAATDTARADLADGAASVGERILIPLLVRMDASDAPTRAAAAGLLQRVTALALPFDAAADRAVRMDQLAAYEAWVLQSAGRLRYDRTARRLVR